MLQMEGQRGRLQTEPRGDDASRQALRAALDEQSENREAMLVGKRAECGEGVG